MFQKNLFQCKVKQQNDHSTTNCITRDWNFSGFPNNCGGEFITFALILKQKEKQRISYIRFALQNQYNVKFTKIECNYDAQYFDDVNCAVNPEDLTIDAVIKPEYTVDNLNVMQAIPDFFSLSSLYSLGTFIDIWQVKVSIYRHTTPRERGRIFLGLNNVTIDICRFFSGKVTSNLMNVLAVGAQNCSNSFHPCPYAVRRCLVLFCNLTNF